MRTIMQNPSNAVIHYRFEISEIDLVDIYVLKGLSGRILPVLPIRRITTAGFVGSVLPKLGRISV